MAMFCEEGLPIKKTGAAAVAINGATYFQEGPNYFLPVMQAGVTVYVTAHP